MRMRCKPEAPSLDRSFSQFSRQVFCQVRKRPHCRRSLSPAEFGKCGIDAFISRDPRGAAIRPIDGGRVCRSLSATATFHAQPHEHPIPPSCPSIVGQLAHGGEPASAIFLPPVTPSNWHNQNHIRIMMLQLSRTHRGAHCLCHFGTAHRLWRSGRHECA